VPCFSHVNNVQVFMDVLLTSWPCDQEKGDPLTLTAKVVTETFLLDHHNHDQQAKDTLF